MYMHMHRNVCKSYHRICWIYVRHKAQIQNALPPHFAASAHLSVSDYIGHANARGDKERQGDKVHVEANGRAGVSIDAQTA